MARISLDELRRLVDRHVDWRSGGYASPFQALSLDLPAPHKPVPEDVFAPELVNKTLTFEGRAVTLVLDFDGSGYLSNIEFA